MKKAGSNKNSAKAAMAEAAKALSGDSTNLSPNSEDSGTTAGTEEPKTEAKAAEPTTAESQVTPTEAAKKEKEKAPKRDIMNDIRTNEHLRKKLWSVKGPICMMLQGTDGQMYKIGINKSDVVNILQRDNATLAAKPLFHLQENPGINQGGTLTTSGPAKAEEAKTAE